MLSQEQLDVLLPISEQELQNTNLSCAELWQLYMVKFKNDKVQARKAMIEGGIVMADDLRLYNSNRAVYKYPNTWENVQYNNGLKANASAETEHRLSEAGIRAQYFKATTLKTKEPAIGALTWVTGKAGCGKTEYMSAWVIDAITKRRPAKYITIEEFTFARAKLNTTQPGAFEAYADIENVAVLAIDGCESMKLTEKQALGLVELLTKRNQNKLTTMLASRNLESAMQCFANAEPLKALIKAAHRIVIK